MSNVLSFGSFQEAYVTSIETLLRDGKSVDPVMDPTSVGSEFGANPKRTKELLGFSFEVTNPRRRSVDSKVRNVQSAFNHANLIWTLNGGVDAGMISHYNQRGIAFAKNQAFYEAAFGARLFYPFQQIRGIEKRLLADPASRRAMAMIYIPEDTIIDKLDTPCATFLHFMIRDEKLVCICNMRSQSAFMVMPYDFFLFSMIHEIVSVRLEIELGSMIYGANSFHIYENEFERAEALVRESLSPPAEMPPIVQGSDKTLSTLIELEQLTRLCKISDTIAQPGSLLSCLDQYWIDFLAPIFHHNG